MKVLATSRAPLRLRGEREFPVGPLEVPDVRQRESVERLSQYDAVRLFIARAQDAVPDFAVTNETAPAVAEICARLDGLPLAIELAAARVKLLSPPALLTRLERRLPLLTGGARDAPARQQALRTTIAWSYDLLAPSEQLLFRRLTVFAGGIALEAAEAVADAPSRVSATEPISPSFATRPAPPTTPSILDLLAGLIDKSLLRSLSANGLESRFRMLETVREFAMERLVASGDEAPARPHACGVVLRARRGVRVRRRGRGNDRRSGSIGWRSDLPNLRAALNWFGGGRCRRSVLGWPLPSKGIGMCAATAPRAARGWIER